MDETTVFNAGQPQNNQSPSESPQQVANEPIQAPSQPVVSQVGEQPQEIPQAFAPVSSSPSAPAAAPSEPPSATNLGYQTESAEAQQDVSPPVPPDGTGSGNSGSFFEKFMNRSSLIKIGIGVVVIILLISVVMIFLGSRSGTSNQVTLTYWGLWENNSVMQPILDDFHRSHPNITIKYEKQDINQYKDRLLTRIHDNNGANAPDVFRFHSSWTPTLTTILAPVPSTTISVTDFKNFFYPVAQHDLIVNGVLYGVPLEVDTLTLFVNTDILKAQGISAPQDWDEFSKAATGMTVKDTTTGKITTSGAAIGTFNTITHAPDLLSLLFLQNGVDFTNPQSSEKNISDALTFYTNFAQTNNAVWDDSLGPSIQAFAAGKTAMYFGYSWDILQIEQANPNLNFQTVPVPHLPGREMTAASYWAEGVSVASPHQKEAMEFLQYLSQKDTEQKLFTEESKTRKFGEPYARVDLADSLKNDPTLYTFAWQANNAFSTYFASNTYDGSLNDKMNKYLENAVNSINIQSTSADSAAQTLVNGVNQVLSSNK